MTKKVSQFPNPEDASEEGVVALGRDLKVDTLVDAYSHGIFPWPHPGYPMLWFCPAERGIIEFKDVHVPTSLQKFMRKMNWTFTLNKYFGGVIRACQDQVRPGQNGTWITPRMIKAYEELHRAGFAISGEVWDGEELVGGIYGVWLNGIFSGESMFFRKSNASKVALLKMIEWLRGQGVSWIDIQMLTSVTQQLGGRYVSRKEFLKLLSRSRRS